MNGQLAQIPAILGNLPDIEIHEVLIDTTVGDRRWDAVIPATVRGRPVRFLIETRTSGYPRDIRQALWRLDEALRACDLASDVPVIAAPSISESSRRLLREHHLAYVDGGGSVYLDLPEMVYWVERPPLPSSAPLLRDAFRGSSAQALHALLLEPERDWKLHALAERAGVAASTAHRVCRFLEEQLWMEKAGSGPRTVRRLLEPGKLLDAWAESHTLTEYTTQHFHRWFREPLELTLAVTGAFEEAGIEHALTLSSGAQFVAPYASGAESVWLLVSARSTGMLGEAASAIGLQPVEEGEAVTFLISEQRSPLLFRRDVQGMWVASDVQLYLDLWAWPKRGREQARHLRAERIGY